MYGYLWVTEWWRLSLCVFYWCTSKFITIFLFLRERNLSTSCCFGFGRRPLRYGSIQCIGKWVFVLVLKYACSVLQHFFSEFWKGRLVLSRTACFCCASHKHVVCGGNYGAKITLYDMRVLTTLLSFGSFLGSDSASEVWCTFTKASHN